MSEGLEIKRPRLRVIGEDARIRGMIGEKLRAKFSFPEDARPIRMFELLERLEMRERAADPRRETRMSMGD